MNGGRTHPHSSPEEEKKKGGRVDKRRAVDRDDEDGPKRHAAFLLYAVHHSGVVPAVYRAMSVPAQRATLPCRRTPDVRQLWVLPGQNELGCEINGRRLEEGQVFQPSCAQLCQCLGGGMTCVPLCSSDLQRPVDKCPNSQLVRPPGRCCKEWVCDSLDNSISSNPSTAEQGRQDFGGGPSGLLFGSTSNCIEWTSDWSPCSHSCGPGVSTRTTNRNWACRLQTETRLCQVRPCQALLPGLRRLQPGSVVCESSYSSPLSVQFEHQGCWSTRAYRPRFCALTCPEGLCCSPSHTRTARIVFRCPKGRLTQQRVMMIESCSCSVTNCRQSPVPAGRSVMSPVWL
ncbi:Connective tissue growth factor CCN family member 2 Hypertrophic chondrocyte-specific protein 24 [Collichthys lucidus]|uniref:Connective tissue growth factor CCN family member 2 Hypertrophic chondrocyte-specific protein 24 n=1 Tax=Collichthys lucidus TaxID=240159 RepID=A0A4V6AN36_COLLU|nr:Connective tissue growth factor CCN family member 2 Hypertrophic chondrocyte-specific protein 24 [Collichthys lucidus]